MSCSAHRRLSSLAAGGYLLDSVGGDCRDDAGLYLMKPWKNQEGDLVWRIRP